jgi:hypothetical protein
LAIWPGLSILQKEELLMPRKTKDPLYRLACGIHRQLQRITNQPDDDRFHLFNLLAQTCRSIGDCWESSQRARSRGWNMAADRRLQAMSEQLQALSSRANLAAHRQHRPPAPVPGIQLLLDELRQIHQEFEQVAIQPKEKRIIVTTSRIVLEDLDLGPFAIELRLDELSVHPGSGCFRCIALDPHPPCTRNGISHPHVSDGQLCAGDASVPLTSAIKQGRLCDAFMLVHSVLNTYNAGSAYVSLDQWEGEPCPDCDRTMNSEESYYCEGCYRSICDNCIGRCDACDESRCDRCLEQDADTDQELCAQCRETCSECGNIVARSRIDVDSKLCPTCLEAHQEQEVEQEPLQPALVLASSTSPTMVD